MKFEWYNKHGKIEENVPFGYKTCRLNNNGKPSSIIVTHGEIEHYKNVNGCGTVGEIAYVKYMNEYLIPSLSAGGIIEIADTGSNNTGKRLSNSFTDLFANLGLVDYHKNKSKINNAKKIDKECALHKHKMPIALSIDNINYNKKERYMDNETKKDMYQIMFLECVSDIAGIIAIPAEMLDLLEEEFNRCYDAGYEDGLFYDFPFDDDEDRDNEPRCYVDEDC